MLFEETLNSSQNTSKSDTYMYTDVYYLLEYIIHDVICYVTCTILFLDIEDTDDTSLEEDEKGSLYTSQELVDEVKKKLSVIEELKITAGNILLILVCFVMNVCLYLI